MISIIVPVFNSKRTLERCVDSILCQNIKDYEIILVDDGSIDGSKELCDYLSYRNPTVRSIHIQNSGTYQARKRGVDVSRGDVITFLDADDWLDKGAYAYLFEEFFNRDVDMLLFTYKYENGDPVSHLFAEGEYNKKQIRNKIIPNMIWDINLGKRRLDPSLCCKIVKKKLYESVTKDIKSRIILGEDAAVTYPMVCRANKLMITDKAFYNYCVTDESSTKNYPIERIDEIQNFRNVLMDKLRCITDFDFRLQIDCYTRVFLDVIFRQWFGCGRSSQMFSFPYELVHQCENIILYGAGDVGKSYYNSIVSSGLHLKGWYDINADKLVQYNGVSIEFPNNMIIDDGDIVLVAVYDEHVFDSIRSELMGLGVDFNKIVWRRPVLVG